MDMSLINAGMWFISVIIDNRREDWIGNWKIEQ